MEYDDDSYIVVAMKTCIIWYTMSLSLHSYTSAKKEV